MYTEPVVLYLPNRQDGDHGHNYYCDFGRNMDELSFGKPWLANISHAYTDAEQGYKAQIQVVICGLLLHWAWKHSGIEMDNPN